MWCSFLLVAGCFQPKGELVISNTSHRGKRTRIRFAFWGGETEIADFRAIAEAFVEKNPDIEVKLECLPWGQYWAKLRTQVAGKIAPDVVRLYCEAGGSWYERGALLPLDEFIKRDGVRLERYFRVAIQACRWKGRVYSLPSDVPVRILAYNKELFDKAGLPYPDPRKPLNWEEFVELAKELTIVRNGRVVQYGFALGPQADLILIHQAGGRLFDRNVDPQESRADSEAVAEGLKFFYDLQFRLKVAPDRDSQESAGFGSLEFPLTSRRVAMAMAGPWTFREYTRAGIKLGLAPLFRGKQRAQISTPNTNGIYRHSKHPEEAWKFVLFLASEPAQKVIARRGVGVPALRDVAYSEDFYNNLYGVKNMRAYCEELEYASPMIMASTGEFTRAYYSVLSGLKLGTFTPGEAVSELDKRFRRTLSALSARPIAYSTRVFYPALLVLLFFALGAFYLLLVRRTERMPPHTERVDNLRGYLFVAPWLVGFVVFNALPIVGALVLSFAKWDMVGAPRWVGTENLSKMLTDEVFFKSLKVTCLYSLCAVPILVGGGLLCALLLQRPFSGRAFFRTVIYLPSMLAGVAMTLVWVWMYNSDVGIINYLLDKIGLGKVPWLDHPHWVLPALILMNILWVGGNMLIFLASLEGVPQSLYDSATVDGAGPIRKFFVVTLPMISPSLLFCTIMSTIGAFHTFTEAFMIRPRSDVGGPQNASMLMVLYIYLKAFRDLEMGYACAVALVLFCVIFVLTYLELVASKRWVYYEAG